MYVGSPSQLAAIQALGGTVIGHANPELLVATLLRTPGGQATLARWRKENSPERLKALLAESRTLTPPRRRERLPDVRQRIVEARRELDADRRVCAHEAGHGIVAAALGVTFSVVRAIGTDDELGSLRGLSDTYVPHSRIAVCAAGPIAEQWHHGRSADDWTDAASASDLRLVADALKRLDKQDRNSILASAERLACDTLRKHDKALAKVSAELARKGWLGRDDVLAIIRNN